ncbi:flippase activity-associated protein Agl23 [Bdellovibrio bacteriovorus]|uniref:Mannosyltransferase n=1 Tax=Bdellovibrio bacteriovorus TaxID=959 RepID=A0A1Z3NAE8_BDEBC|nr:flippase activity-associated protein Agl23 [Bdellovibrio bacteriovorus]ASD64427.1 mannosyltransferase [Bdellovibrio bacteriovorus]
MKSFKVTNFSHAAFWAGLFLLALISRFALLTNKPIHFDESINGWFVMQMSKLGYYKYDPNNYHGPMYFYLLQGFETLWGRSLETLRTVPAMFSVLSVVILAWGALRPKAVNMVMAVLVLISPAFIFFGRSGIHEMPFVFFQLVAGMGILRWIGRQDEKALGLFLIGLWGMMALKETFVITMFAWVVAFLILGWSHLRTMFSPETIRLAWSGRLTVLTVLLLLIFLQLFTGFYQNLSGIVDFFKAVLPWLKTGVHGHGHEKSVWYWVQVLYTAEPLVLFGGALAVAGVFSKRKELRAVSVFSLVQLAVYSLIPYKTVWCVLSLVWGFYFVLAMTLVNAFESRFLGRHVLAGVALILAALGLRSAWISVYQRPIDLTHPYVYVNSTYELVQVSDLITGNILKKPSLAQQRMQVGMKEQWPWPWLLRYSNNLSYELCSKRILEDASVYFCDYNVGEYVERLLNEPYWKLEVVFRQSREPSLIYLRKADFDLSDYKGPKHIVGPELEESP